MKRIVLAIMLLNVYAIAYSSTQVQEKTPSQNILSKKDPKKLGNYACSDKETAKKMGWIFLEKPAPIKFPFENLVIAIPKVDVRYFPSQFYITAIFRGYVKDLHMDKVAAEYGEHFTHIDLKEVGWPQPECKKEQSLKESSNNSDNITSEKKSK